MKKRIKASDRAMGLIAKNHIKPIPKWEFELIKYGLWLGLGTSLLVLIIGVSISWFGLADNIIVPYLWLFVAVTFFGLVYFLFKKTKGAYRFEMWKILGLIGIFGLLMGGVIFKAGLASRIDRNLETNLPYYRQIVPMKLKVWSNPESGYLSGQIIEITGTDSFKIKDFNNKDWDIDSENSLIRGRVTIVVGEEIKLIGTQTGASLFKAEEIRPWNGMGQNMMKENYK
jgi:hypothetical protein